MILPIVAYGDPVLRQKGKPIDNQYPELNQLIENMFETMYASYGVGLAAPQIGLSIRLFVIDPSPFAENKGLSKEEKEQLLHLKKVFINPQIIEETGEEWIFNEGCLSIPGIHQDVKRKESITIKYLDENFKEYTEIYTGIAARVMQHEYDHIEGILFTDKISSLKKRLIKKKLENITNGKVSVEYKMRFPNTKKGR